MATVNELTVGDLIKKCKEYNLDPDKTPVMYSGNDDGTLIVLINADVNKDIIEVY
jgi:hypothetical protein